MKYLYLALLVFALSACGEEVADLTAEEYVMENNLNAIELDKGVYIVIDRPGNDKKPNINSRVTVNYEGSLTNGSIFETASNAEFQLANLIEGWRIGLKEIGEGGSCILVIPPAVGYGSQGTSAIPANSTLVFNMDLVEVQ